LAIPFDLDFVLVPVCRAFGKMIDAGLVEWVQITTYSRIIYKLGNTMYTSLDEIVWSDKEMHIVGSC